MPRPKTLARPAPSSARQVSSPDRIDAHLSRTQPAQSTLIRLLGWLLSWNPRANVTAGALATVGAVP
jgi:hypothetical protein